MGEARRIRNYGVGDEGLMLRVMAITDINPSWVSIQLRKAWGRAQPFPRLNARSPAAEDNLLDALSPLGDLTVLQSVEARHEARVLDHECHELGGISTNAEEFQIILLNELLKDRMGSDTNPVAICVL